MGELLVIIFGRELLRTIGKYSRFIFYRFIGRKRTLRSLSDISKDMYSDVQHALNQDFLNAFVGAIMLVFIIVLCTVLYSSLT